MQNDEKQPTAASPIEHVVSCDLDEIALAIYDYIMCEGMTEQILKAKIVPCMKGHKSAGVSYVKCELQDLLKSKSN